MTKKLSTNKDYCGIPSIPLHPADLAVFSRLTQSAAHESAQCRIGQPILCQIDHVQGKHQLARDSPNKRRFPRAWQPLQQVPASIRDATLEVPFFAAKKLSGVVENFLRPWHAMLIVDVAEDDGLDGSHRPRARQLPSQRRMARRFCLRAATEAANHVWLVDGTPNTFACCCASLNH